MHLVFPLVVCSFLLLAGCGLWPFGDSGRETSRAPADATEYQCEGGKRFYLRYLNNGESAWIIFPERQFRLDKVASASGTRYAYGSSALDVTRDTLTLNDGSTGTYTGCKAGGAK
jgi:membrane-bound inhibitor of C-type lysozyme